MEPTERHRPAREREHDAQHLRRLVALLSRRPELGECDSAAVLPVEARERILRALVCD